LQDLQAIQAQDYYCNKLFVFLLDMDDGCEIFVKVCSNIGQSVARALMDGTKFYIEKTLSNG
jgi:hypothetical protein